MKFSIKKLLAFILIFTFLTGLIPAAGSVSLAAEYDLSNPRIFIQKPDPEEEFDEEDLEEEREPVEQSRTVWDCIWFGRYWQEDTDQNGKADKRDAKTPIKWRVLSVEGDDVFLLADKNLDCQRYNDKLEWVAWDTCTMRSWLNGYGPEKNALGKDYRNKSFYHYAFTKQEKQAIVTTNVVTEKRLSLTDHGFMPATDHSNFKKNVESGNYSTFDKLYLLSLEEVTNPQYGFSVKDMYDWDWEKRTSMATVYTLQGGEIKSKYISNNSFLGNTQWWLRSPCAIIRSTSTLAAFVYNTGSVGTGYSVDAPHFAVRPALHLNLKAVSKSGSSPGWLYAGTVSSDGKVKETAPFPLPLKWNRKITIVKSKGKKCDVSLSWKKSPGAKGYQICYSTSKKWKNKKQELVSKNKVTMKNLEKKKTYYFRVRAYQLKEKKKVYGAWSSTKKFKIKK